MGIAPFKNGRMFVGWRLRDWKLVYYAPYVGGDADQNDSSLTPSLYFTTPTGDEEGLMMEGEVAFLPHFSQECCEAKTKPERRAMQMRNLMDAHKLYNEKNHSRFAELMEEMEDPTWRRWNSIMSEIKAFRNPKISAKKAKDAKKKAKEAQAAAFAEAGVPEDDIDGNLTSDSDDSGFEDDDDNEVGLVSRRKRAPMAPPPKRPNGNGNNNPDQRKKRKPAARPPARQASEDLQMSGGLGRDSDNARARLSRRGSLGGVMNGRGYTSSPDFDPNPPEENASDNGLFVSRSPMESNTERRNRLSGYNQPAVEDIEDIDGDASFLDASAYNGTVGESDAIDRAIRESQQPEETDLDRALRVSQQPEARPEADVTESTEDQYGVNRGGTRTARNSASSRGGGSRNGSRSGSGEDKTAGQVK